MVCIEPMESRSRMTWIGMEQEGARAFVIPGVLGYLGADIGRYQQCSLRELIVIMSIHALL